MYIKYFSFFLLLLFFTAHHAEAALSCSVTTTCNSPNVVVFRMSGISNAHAGTAGGSSYTQLVCCGGETGLGNSCSGTFATAVKLQAANNSHVQQNDQNGYTNSACLSMTSGTVSVGYQAASCSGFDTTIASMSGVTNAHLGDANAYTTKICGSAAGASLTLTVSTDSFSIISPGTAKFATTTIAVSTSNQTGWSVNLTSDDRTLSNTTMDLDSNAAVGVQDQFEWIPGQGTTTPGNALRIASFANAGDVLAFRVMTASGTPSLRASAWWGSTDSYVDAATTLWAGLASTTATNPKIGNSGVASVGTALNTVLYYLRVPPSQQVGAYSAPLTITATVNP